LLVVKADCAEHRNRCRGSQLSFTTRIPRVTVSTMHLNPWNVLLIAIAGWMNREQVAVIEYLKEENRVLRELLGKKRPRLSDDQRRRLAAKGIALGRKLLSTCCSIVTPDTA
jgi:hypothetical protein